MSDKGAALSQRVGVLRRVAGEGELPAVERARARFEEGETQFLLENFEGSEALLREAVWVPEFQLSPEYPLALYYLGESLLHTGGHAKAQATFIEAARLLPPGRLRQDVLTRLIALAHRPELAAKNQTIDSFYREEVQTRNLRPELGYRYAAWVALREDLAPEQAQVLAHRELSRLESTPFASRALYFRAALYVEQGDYFRARALFERLLDSEVVEDEDSDERHLRDLANLGVARILHDSGDFEQALEFYGKISPDSPEYPDALHEKADCYVRLQRYDDALESSALLRRALGGALSADAGLFEARLLLQLGFHERAIASFEEVVEKLIPDREQIRAILSQSNPIAYFEELLSRPEAIDLNSLLPERARARVDTSQAVESARHTTQDLHRTRQDVEQARKLVLSMKERLESGGLALFPELLENDSHAIQLANACAALEHQLVNFQVRVLSEVLNAEEKAELELISQKSEELSGRFKELPKTREELAARREAFARRLGELERAKAAVGRQLFELRAELQALEQSLPGRVQEVQGEAEGEQRGFLEEERVELRQTLAQFRRLVEQLRQVDESLDQKLSHERRQIPSLASGGTVEEELRAAYRQQILAMQRIIARAGARVSRERRPLLVQSQRARTELDKMQEDIATVRAQLAQRAQAEAELYRQRVLEEAEALEQEAAQLSVLEENSRQLLGEVAWGSFQRAGRWLDDLMMQGEVGILDVAWDAKELKSREMREIGGAREEELQKLREQFREVLSHAD